jgi:gliding motility-associated-like protein
MRLAMKKTVLLFLLLPLGLCPLAQGQYNNWHFGNGSAINFKYGYPAVTNNSQIASVSACASISDTLGNLLFYTNGDTIWDQNNSIMPNGMGLLGDYTAQQGVLIVPNPDTVNSKNQYYIFTVGAPSNGFAKELRYSIVDMNLNDSLGAVDSTAKNILLDSNVTEKLTATRNADGISFWVVTRNLGSGSFKAYSITDTGLNPAPVISNAGVGIQNGDYSGALKISNNGCWMISTTRGLFKNPALVEILHFDNSYGSVSRGYSTTSILHPYGLEFSPDNTKFYIGENEEAPVYQFNLNQSNDQDILPSQLAVSNPYPATYSMQAAPDGKIYFVTSDTTTLGSIQNPDNYSLYCNVDTAVVTGLNFNTYSLPNNFDLTYKGALSCAQTTQDCVMPLNKLMPNAFTPNGDGLNDCFGVDQKIKDSLPFLDFAIFDRWGNKVFYTTTISECWDGTYKGKPADQANYVYYLRERTNCGYALKTGYVVLIR